MGQARSWTAHFSFRLCLPQICRFPSHKILSSASFHRFALHSSWKQSPDEGRTRSAGMQVRLFCTEISIVLFQFPIYAQAKWEKMVNRSGVFLKRPESYAIAQNCHGKIEGGWLRARNSEAVIITINDNTPMAAYMPAFAIYKSNHLLDQSVKKIEPCPIAYRRPMRPDVRWRSSSKIRTCFGTSKNCCTERIPFFKWISIWKEYPRVAHS